MRRQGLPGELFGIIIIQIELFIAVNGTNFDDMLARLH